MALIILGAFTVDYIVIWISYSNAYTRAHWHCTHYMLLSYDVLGGEAYTLGI